MYGWGARPPIHLPIPLLATTKHPVFSLICPNYSQQTKPHEITIGGDKNNGSTYEILLSERINHRHPNLP